MRLKPISCPICGAISGHEKLEEGRQCWKGEFDIVGMPFIVTTWSCGGCGRKFETRAFEKLRHVDKLEPEAEGVGE